MTDNIRDSYGADDDGGPDPLRDPLAGSADSGEDALGRTSTSAPAKEPALTEGSASAGHSAGHSVGSRAGGRSSRSSGSRTAGRPNGPAGGRADDRQGPVGSAGTAIRRIRDLLASAVLTVTVLAAVVLALGAVLTALGANPDNAIVSTVRDLGGQLDGPFADLFTFAGEPGKQLLVNWGIAALAYLIVGRVLERVVRP